MTRQGPWNNGGLQYSSRRGSLSSDPGVKAAPQAGLNHRRRGRRVCQYFFNGSAEWVQLVMDLLLQSGIKRSHGLELRQQLTTFRNKSK